MFDTYIPEETLKCPVCGNILSVWQGKEGSLFVWAQNIKNPIDQEAGNENVKEHLRSEVILPSTFTIYSHECNCPYPVEAICKTLNDVWVSTNIIDFTNAKQKKDETKANFINRLAWLKQKQHNKAVKRDK